MNTYLILFEEYDLVIRARWPQIAVAMFRKYWDLDLPGPVVQTTKRPAPGALRIFQIEIDSPREEAVLSWTFHSNPPLNEVGCVRFIGFVEPEPEL